jgi:hypothetical protein
LMTASWTQLLINRGARPCSTVSETKRFEDPAESWTDCFALAIFKRETQHTQFIGESSAPKYLPFVSNLLFAIVFVCLVVVGRIVSFVKLFKQPNKFKSFKQQLIF